jgi:hypothetical protein
VKVITVSGLKQFWQTLIQRLSPRVPWSASDLEREFSVARQERQHLLNQLSDLHAESEQRVSAGQRERQDLLDQLKALHARMEQELTASGLEKQALRGALNGLRSEVEQGLEAALQEQQGLLGQLGGLQSEVAHGLEAAHQEQQALQGQLGGLRSEIEHGLEAAHRAQQGLQGQLGNLQAELELVRDRDEELRADLRQRFEQIQIGRDAANQEIVTLRTSLLEADARQASMVAQVNSLETGLKRQRQEYDVALQQTLIQERRLRRRLTVAMTVAAAAFILGIVGGAINFWGVKDTTRLLVEVSRGIRDIQTIIAGQSSTDAPASSQERPPAAPKDRGLPEVSQSPHPGTGSSTGNKTAW